MVGCWWVGGGVQDFKCKRNHKFTELKNEEINLESEVIETLLAQNLLSNDGVNEQ